MSFNAIRENKIIAKVSEFTYLDATVMFKFRIVTCTWAWFITPFHSGYGKRVL